MRMRRVTWTKVGASQITTYLESPTPYAYSLYNFQGAAVIINGSLLMSLPIIKSFGAMRMRRGTWPKVGVHK